MNLVQTTQAVVEASATPPSKGIHTVMDISGEMVVLTWLMFTVTAFILYKIAWKPILAALDKRESEIKAALDSADQARQNAAQTRQQCEQMLSQADAQAREMLEQARKASQEASDSIRAQAREEAKLMLSNAEHEINFQKEKAVDALRKESAQLAIDMAGALIRKNLNTGENQELTEIFLKKL